jgi:hypothetical protein
MMATGHSEGADPLDEATISRARERGFTLVSFESDHGTSIFEWRRSDEPGPKFPSRRAALEWMTERLVDPGAADVS